MKKFAAIAFVVLMLVATLPFTVFADTVYWTEVKTAEDFAKMTDGNYWLTADIDLSKTEWKTILKFSGTLNGNGHTVTVPTNTTMFDMFAGTVKNLNLKGTMALDTADVSLTTLDGIDVKGGGVGALANYAFGATVENVHSNVDLSYIGTNANVGGLFGNVMSNHVIKFGQSLEIVKHTTIKNTTISGNYTVTYEDAPKAAVGGITGCALGGTAFENVAVYATVNVVNSKGHNAGLVGAPWADGYRKPDGGGLGNLTEVVTPVTFTNCLFAGDFIVDTTDRCAAFAAYARGAVFTNCISSGKVTSGGNIAHLLGYCNVQATLPQAVGFIGCASVAEVTKGGSANNTVINGKGKGLTYKDGYFVEGQTYSVANDDADHISGNKTFPDAATVTDKFVEANSANFKLNEGKVELIVPAFTAEAAPDFSAKPPVVDPATTTGGNPSIPKPPSTQQQGPTTRPVTEATTTAPAAKEEGGCKGFTVSLGAVVAVVSLAAVTVLSKKKH